MKYVGIDALTLYRAEQPVGNFDAIPVPPGTGRGIGRDDSFGFPRSRRVNLQSANSRVGSLGSTVVDTDVQIIREGPGR